MTGMVPGPFPPDPRQLTDRRQFGEALTFLRELAGYTVRDMAKVLGIPTATAGDYFAGRTLPPVKMADVLCRVLRSCGVVDKPDIEEWQNALVRIRRARWAGRWPLP